MSSSARLYHGGVSGLVPGQKLLPPARTGARSCSDYDGRHCRPDHVYLTADPTEAAVYAALASSGGDGDVYEVEPVGELEPDPPGDAAASAYAARAAIVVAIVRRAIPLQEAVAAMETFALRQAEASVVKDYSWDPPPLLSLGAASLAQWPWSTASTLWPSGS
jgi:hypothetical protein